MLGDRLWVWSGSGLAMVIFGVTSGEALADGVGPLIEVPVLIAMVYVSLAWRRKFPTRDRLSATYSSNGKMSANFPEHQESYRQERPDVLPIDLEPRAGPGAFGSGIRRCYLEQPAQDARPQRPGRVLEAAMASFGSSPRWGGRPLVRTGERNAPHLSKRYLISRRSQRTHRDGVAQPRALRLDRSPVVVEVLPSCRPPRAGDSVHRRGEM